jgi:hypothetical protein
MWIVGMRTNRKGAARLRKTVTDDRTPSTLTSVSCMPILSPSGLSVYSQSYGAHADSFAFLAMPSSIR